jgi:hypothetical protein
VAGGLSVKSVASPPAHGAPSAARHRLVAAGAALAVMIAGGGLFWGSTLREWRAFLGVVHPSVAPEAAPAEGQTVQVRLAFLGADGRTLEEEPRELTLTPSPPGAARAILEALRAGSRQGRRGVLSRETQVRHVFVDTRGVAYVDLSAEFLRPAGGGTAEPANPAPGAAQGQAAGGEARTPAAPGGAAVPAKAPGEGEVRPPVVLAAQAVAATLGMSLPEIAQVQILVEGREVPVVTEEADLRRPLPASLPMHPPAASQ